jgi:putative transposase
VQRLMRQMGIQALYPRKTTVPAAGHKIYPYLLRRVKIARVNQVWSTDITYVPMQRGFTRPSTTGHLGRFIAKV